MTAALKLIEGGRGYTILYRRQHVNFCPGCGKTHWYLRSKTAECAFCCLALHYGEAGNG